VTRLKFWRAAEGLPGRAGLVSAVRGQPYLRRNRQNI